MTARIDARTDRPVPSIMTGATARRLYSLGWYAALPWVAAYLFLRSLRQPQYRSNWRERLVEMLRGALLDRLLNERMSPGDLVRLAADVAEHRRDPYSLVEEIVSGFGEQSAQRDEVKSKIG